jgi:hypothetical protein
MTTQTQPDTLVTQLKDAIYKDGITTLPNALPREWAAQLDEDLGAEFIRALGARKGTAPRGWNRFYFEPYPERIRGFMQWVTQPTMHALSLEMFGPEYKIVELGCDTPLPGAVNQPWHRDFPLPDESRYQRILTSIAVNASSVDVAEDMGPFQTVKGSHFDDDANFEEGLFPPESDNEKYEAGMTSMYGKMGSLSIRSGLAIHRGSASSVRSVKRQVAILGIVSPADRAVKKRIAFPNDGTVPRLRISRQYLATIPREVLHHLSIEVVSETEKTLPPHFTHHDFEGLKMSEFRA